ncbi:MAG: hypothetical protein IKQ31_04680 [Clostridia bacterium]|nr:hypothetical protein [Clostridia bacterium]
MKLKDIVERYKKSTANYARKIKIAIGNILSKTEKLKENGRELDGC